ncbi:hydrogenase [Siccirubricoccus deserti]|uniref:Cytochrome b/b6 domain-containing protein n=1 Tax=Siccirubricoccus deserti TaxID=2013562 RepID=A0A9X0R1I6_9PROT|nr:cytochrome b/b6 domain-containing protein [Siccirubricoccus deserti]MBC4017138.1 cytochrome b/b6 domain-containing protein [Siccirubricoccus deserti]GGC57086.1 hydrogenase [Siccirubricoccus deserti]
MDDQHSRQVKVWDGWIRLVHWSVVVLLGLSWWSVEAGQMRIHYLSGHAVLTLVLFRIAWGLVGSETARFSRFLRSPLAALRHLGGLRRREPDHEIGHNAAGGWMVLVLLGLLLAQPLTGLFAAEEPGFSYGAKGPLAAMVSPDTSDWLTGLHHRIFNLIMIAALLHIAAVLAYALLKRHDLVRPMVTGRKRLPARLAAPRIGSPTLAAGLLAASALLVYGISRLG